MKDKKKPRKTEFGSVKFEARSGHEGSIVFDEVHGCITVRNDDDPTVYEYPLMVGEYYEGQTKRRYSFYVPFNTMEYVNDVRQALHDYDVVCAVDTSKYEMDGLTLTAGVITYFTKYVGSDEKTIGLIRACMVDCHSSQPTEFEQMNWLNAIRWFKSDAAQIKILMVVDCNKDALPDYNEKKVPICGTEQLPDDVTLMYASDRSDDSWMNKMIRCSDKGCKDIVKQFKEKGCYDYSIHDIRAFTFLGQRIGA